MTDGGEVSSKTCTLSFVFSKLERRGYTLMDPVTPDDPDE